MNELSIHLGWHRTEAELQNVQNVQKRNKNYCFIANTLADSVMININR